MSDVAEVAWSAATAKCLSLCTGARAAETEHLVAAATTQLFLGSMQGVSQATLANTAPRLPAAGKAADAFAGAVLAAMLLRPACTTAMISTANAQGAAAKLALFALLNRGFEQPGSGGEAQTAQLLSGMHPVTAALAAAVALPHEDCAAAHWPVQHACRWFADVYLQLMSCLEVSTWRERAECLVSQIAALAEAVTAPRGAELKPLASALRSSGASLTGTAAQQALWLRLEALMPLMPIVYSTRTGAGHSASLRLAVALAGLHVELHGSTPRPRLLCARMLTLLHMLVLDEWARWLKCHQTKRKIQALGGLPDSSAVAAVVRKAAVTRPATALALAAALDTPLQPKWGSQAGAEPATGVESWRMPWRCMPPLKGSVVWMEGANEFEKGGSHEALEGAPRSVAAPPRFAALMQPAS